jgi:hypothetical protein
MATAATLTHAMVSRRNLTACGVQTCGENGQRMCPVCMTTSVKMKTWVHRAIHEGYTHVFGVRVVMVDPNEEAGRDLAPGSVYLGRPTAPGEVASFYVACGITVG